MMIREGAVRKIMFVCDFCETLPKKSISKRGTTYIRDLATVAKSTGWFIKPVTPNNPKTDWLHICPDCVSARLATLSVEAIAEISSIEYAKKYIEGQKDDYPIPF
jgi:hypothetical protein